MAATADSEGQGPDLAARLAETAGRCPTAVALRWREAGATPGGESEMTFAELDARVTAAAAALQGLGVRPTGGDDPRVGDRVALLLGNTPLFVAAFLGALRAGATVVPLNPGLTTREVTAVLRDAGARVLIVGDPAAAVVGDLRDTVPDLEHVVVAGSAVDGATATWEELVAAERPYTSVRRGPDDVAALVYTSGTTGRPRGAMLTRRNLDANQRQVLASRLGLRPDDIVLCALPLFHIYALNVGLGCAVRVGATLVLAERFDPVASLDDLARHGVTVVLGAPPMYVAWLGTAEAATAPWSQVRLAVSGAAPLPASVLTRFRERHGVTIWEGYGLTEASPVVTSTVVGSAAKPGSVGLPLPEVALRLVDDRGRDADRGDPGEVWVRGPNVFAGYWEDPEATAEALTDEGWLRTGDVGVLDEDGYLYLVDRKTDLIIVSGFNVYPREVEDVLQAHPDVLQAAVVGIPHPYTGEAVKAVVVAAPGADLTAEQVVAWSRQHLARFKCPEVVEFLGALPVTATGKVRRRALR